MLLNIGHTWMAVALCVYTRAVEVQKGDGMLYHTDRISIYVLTCPDKLVLYDEQDKQVKWKHDHISRIRSYLK